MPFTTYDEIFRTICDELANEFDCPREKLTEDALLVDDLDLDSIDAIDLVVRLQKMTNLKVSAEDFKSIRTLGDLAHTIEKLIAKANA